MRAILDTKRAGKVAATFPALFVSVSQCWFHWFGLTVGFSEKQLYIHVVKKQEATHTPPLLDNNSHKHFPERYHGNSCTT